MGLGLAAGVRYWKRACEGGLCDLRDKRSARVAARRPGSKPITYNVKQENGVACSGQPCVCMPCRLRQAPLTRVQYI